MNTDFYNLYRSCKLCPRECGIDRTAGRGGFCRSDNRLTVARAALHMWEEPIISGTRGSGTVFFSGCSLGCVYCQNREISRGEQGREIDDSRLADIFMELLAEGAHNINLVTPTHFIPHIISAVDNARARGLSIPVVYNTSSYDKPDVLGLLSGRVDIFLADLRYYRDSTAKKYSQAPDYPSVAARAIEKMVEITGPAVLDGEMLARGTVVRILLLPGHLAEAKLSLKYLFDRFGNDIYISLMNQYTPMTGMPPPLDRKVTNAEYRELVDYAERLGVTKCFIQEGGTATESFIPPFDLAGVLPTEKTK